jgi:hypothetical protein
MMLTEEGKKRRAARAAEIAERVAAFKIEQRELLKELAEVGIEIDMVSLLSRRTVAQRLADLINVPVEASPTTLFITQRGSYWPGLPHQDSTGQYGAPMYPVYQSLRVYTPSLRP